MTDKPLAGPTGQFPRGKIAPDDDGELQIAITVKGGLVVIHFGTKVQWLAMSKAEALALCDVIGKRAAELPE